MNDAPSAVLVVGLIFLFTTIVWFIGSFNRLVRVRNAVFESWSGIDTELKRRHDLIPNLVETVKRYAEHERDVLERVIRARQLAINSYHLRSELADYENSFVGSLRNLFVVAEQYPDLKADRHFLALQEQLVHTEDRIQRARRFYNANVRDQNNTVQVFPTNIIASLFNFGPAEYFEIEDASIRLAPTMNMSHQPLQRD
ncbi:MAG: LemA family protein [Pirellulales bacterium]|nr:LemA family protein [Pirellulales bacterium]